MRNYKISFFWLANLLVVNDWHAKIGDVFVTFLSMVDVVRGSHVTTIDGDRFCGADDNVGGFGNVLVTGRHTQANIFIDVVF